MFKEIAAAIEKSKNVVIMPHANGDGDCLGSSYALKLALESIGKTAVVFTEDGENNSRILKVLNGVEPYEEINADTVIALDVGDKKLLGARSTYFDKFENSINIDHHPTNDNFAKYNYVDSGMGATGMIIYLLMRYMGIEVTTEIASNLYVSIISDTGGFAFSNTTAQTHIIAAELLKYDFDHSGIYAYLMNSCTIPALALLKMAYESFEVYESGAIALVSITREQIAQSGATMEETGIIIDVPRKLDTAEVAMSLKETDAGIKVSLRSTSLDVSRIAKKFGGGGHVRASACTIDADLSTAKTMLVAAAKKLINGE